MGFLEHFKKLPDHFIFFQFYRVIIDIENYISLNVQRKDLTYIHHAMMTIISLENIHHLI